VIANIGLTARVLSRRFSFMATVAKLQSVGGIAKDDTKAKVGSADTCRDLRRSREEIE
jgi:hypothetical protein